MLNGTKKNTKFIKMHWIMIKALLKLNWIEGHNEPSCLYNQSILSKSLGSRTLLKCHYWNISIETFRLIFWENLWLKVYLLSTVKPAININFGLNGYYSVCILRPPVLTPVFQDNFFMVTGVAFIDMFDYCHSIIWRVSFGNEWLFTY